VNIEVNIINAFSIGNTGGNPAGVVFDAGNLSREMKQQVATSVGLAETAFVSASAAADYKLEFFTPTKQIAHCGHATIATFSYLKKMNKITADHSSKETIDGIRTIIFTNGLAYMEQKSPVYHEPVDHFDKILDSLHIGPEELLAGLKPTIVNTGNGFLVVPVKNTAVLASIDYDREAVYAICEQYNLIGFYLYTADDTDHNVDATTRMFGPFYGIDEESATGMAAGPLAAYLYDIAGRQKPSFRVQQGRFMKQPSSSLIEVNLDIRDDKIAHIFAGGDAYVSGVKVVSLQNVDAGLATVY
jgi:PhzF family phenazine biosynthesis protein